ncbi:MAG: transcription antitermination factor NusB [Deltaproteobacteria bacterium]|nr:transcription antitermination factor NusB [Deltaproteobacteria bacterium]
MAPGARRKARAFALQILYAHDAGGSVAVDAAASGWDDNFEVDIDPAGREFASGLAQAAVAHLAAIDEVIAGASKNWRLDRMARVDRNILRLATCELRDFPDVPVKVAINEAVELAKRFGTAESPAFVNGILDRVAAALGRSPES